MASTYNFNKNQDVAPDELYTDISMFFRHLVPLDVELQGFELKPDGTVTVRVDKPLPAEQLAHLGMS